MGAYRRIGVSAYRRIGVSAYRRIGVAQRALLHETAALFQQGLRPGGAPRRGPHAIIRVEADHGRLSEVPSDAWAETGRTVSVIIMGHAFMQDLRRGHYELGVVALASWPSLPHIDELKR